MDWLDGMNRAVVYIEERLDGALNLAQAAQQARCSIYHFQRIFLVMTNVPLSEYVRRRRLSKAAFELQSSDIKVIDLALKYGYNSPTAFTRAFQAMHGMPPAAVRTTAAAVKAYPPISFQISIKGAVEMEYKIIEKEEFRVVGVKCHTTMEDGFCMREIPEFWNKCHAENVLPKLTPLMAGQPAGVLGVNYNADINQNELDYYVAVCSEAPTPDGMEELTIPAATWAVFSCFGPLPDAMQSLQNRVLTEWLPSSGYAFGMGVNIEVYCGEDIHASDYRCEVWLPVVKKD